MNSTIEILRSKGDPRWVQVVCQLSKGNARKIKEDSLPNFLWAFGLPIMKILL